MSEESLRERARRWFIAGMGREPTEEELQATTRIAEGRLPFDLHPETEG